MTRLLNVPHLLKASWKFFVAVLTIVLFVPYPDLFSTWVLATVLVTCHVALQGQPLRIRWGVPALCAVLFVAICQEAWRYASLPDGSSLLAASGVFLLIVGSMLVASGVMARGLPLQPSATYRQSAHEAIDALDADGFDEGWSAPNPEVGNRPTYGPVSADVLMYLLIALMALLVNGSFAQSGRF